MIVYPELAGLKMDKVFSVQSCPCGLRIGKLKNKHTEKQKLKLTVKLNINTAESAWTWRPGTWGHSQKEPKLNRPHFVINDIFQQSSKPYTCTYAGMMTCMYSKKISNNQELIQSDPISCPQNQKGNN